MDSNSPPSKILLPFANAGGKNTIPVLANPTPGGASYTEGFPPLTRTPIASGGVPPFGVDMNGILFEISSVARWLCAGGLFEYDSALSTQIGGYPKGAVLLRSDEAGFWLNTTENNTSNPDAGGAGWIPVMGNLNGIFALNTTQTLTPAHAGSFIGIAAAGITLTLPTRASLPDGAMFEFVNSNGNGNSTIAPPAGDVFVFAFGATKSSLLVGPGDSVRIVKFGSTWVVVGGSLQLGVSGSLSFGSSLATLGYQRLPSGRIEVQGTFVASATPGNPVAVAFVQTAANIRNLVLTPVSSGTSAISAWFDTPTGSGFNGHCSVASATVHYRAILD